mmetsp:Transcript_59890/g.135486  ORF Transcript_59890/g.135486 Transcript_59890/m.135486 type:complete len:171 (+) Transcript_59890:90-602(+)|eukprot:CAMPEP_0172616994 /NCGR_PEP_ID=MMETSP1068-20121228/69387_1 /TAXON_ID=35684 /ORGANISM="Pseudopedinella elastica, Strain CCMP716" /LENGTH=170 /DNA_ID=CAMNT_0013422635 /DNA_START=85 /DNA_END=597 /DNA_ORIENTATION=+
MIKAFIVALVAMGASAFQPPSRVVQRATIRYEGLYIPGMGDKEKPAEMMVLEGDEWLDLPLPDEIAREEGLQDIAFCERLPETERKASGLFLPGKATPKLHVARVVSTGNGLTNENGHFAPNADIKRGDIVFLKDPWGIGPRDEEYTDETGVLRRFSYVRYANIAGVAKS